MAGVTPNSTTAGLAAKVPKEGGSDPVINSAHPDSTSAELAKQVSMERNAGVPGSFPETPSHEPENFSVNPIPASSGTGNPVHLKPGEKVPDASTTNEHSIASTVRTDKAAYDADASAPLPGNKETDDLALPTESKNFIPESGLPMGEQKEGSDPGYTIHSVGPASTTAALAANVPKESRKNQTDDTAPAKEVPGVVKNSMAESHQAPEASSNSEAVEDKQDMEEEIRQKVGVNQSSGTPGPTVTAATTETAPRGTERQPDSAQLSPRSTTPTQPTVTTGIADATAPSVSQPTNEAAKPSEPSSQGAGADAGAGTSGQTDTKKKRRSFFSKLKEKLK